MPDLHNLANILWTAQEKRAPCQPLTTLHPDLSVEDAYNIQGMNLRRRPGRQIGHKIGLTSVAVQQWLGVDEPDFGGLLDDMLVLDGQKADITRLLQPRAEAEIAFVLKDDLDESFITPSHVIAATDFILPAIEIIDSRIQGWTIRYQDTIADNASSGLFVLGNNPIRLTDVDLSLAGMMLKKNGQVVSTGAGAACLGHPVNAVVWLANTMRRLGSPLKAGHIILSGALGPVTDISAGDHLEAHVAHVGTVSVQFSKP